MQSKKTRFIAGLWLAIVCLLFGYNSYLVLVKKVTPNTDILALLPNDQRDPVLQHAFDHVINTAQQKVIVLVGAKTWPQAVAAADAYNQVISTRPDLLHFDITHVADAQNNWVNLFSPSRLGLLTQDQQQLLQTQPASYWLNQALSRLYSPFGGIKLTAWQDDPFGLFGDWWQAHAAETPVRPRDGKLFVSSADAVYVVLMMNLQQPAFSMTAQEAVLPLLSKAKQAAFQKVPDADIISSGMVLHAAAASSQASHEMSTIGLGSLLGILLLMWFTFRSLKPIVFIALSLIIGCLGAFAICTIIFGQIHLLTLVFGASLVGIAQDYAIYFLCSRAAVDSSYNSSQLLKQLWPGLSLTLTAALLGYLGLALTPFPGLRQMAVFSSLGLVFAWLTVICWFPILVKAKSFTITPLATKYNVSCKKWPIFSWHKKTIVAWLIIVAITCVGWLRLTTSDDIRALQKPSQQLINDQLKLNKLLDVPSPVQFYLVQGATPEIVLQHEEVLTAQLKPLISKHVISGYQAISDWVPSMRMQQANQQLMTKALLATDGPLSQLAKAIHANKSWASTAKDHMLAATALITPEVFLKSPNSEPWQYLWLGQVQQRYASIVAIKGLNSYANLPLLQSVAGQVTGVEWVDKVASISAVLKHYRQYMSGIVLLAYGVIFLLLSLRYGRSAWRVLAPPAIASVLTLALMGFFGIPLQLFHVLALMLILGLGVDYGIFLQEQSPRQQNNAWLTVGLSAISALLSFGLLALSSTPPLHAFGLTMLVGMALVWLLAPYFGNNNG